MDPWFLGMKSSAPFFCVADAGVLSRVAFGCERRHCPLLLLQASDLADAGCGCYPGGWLHHKPFRFKTEADIYRHTESPPPNLQTLKCYLLAVLINKNPIQLFPSEDVFQLLRTSFGSLRTFFWGGSLTELLLGLSLFLSVLHTYNTFPNSMLSPLSAIESCLETGGSALLGADSEAETQPFIHSLEGG